MDRASTWDVITNDLKLISEFLLKQTILLLFSTTAFFIRKEILLIKLLQVQISNRFLLATLKTA